MQEKQYGPSTMDQHIMHVVREKKSRNDRAAHQVGASKVFNT